MHIRVEKNKISTMPLITTRIQRIGEGTVFSLFVSPHLDEGQGYTISGLGGTLSQVWMGGGTPS